MNRFSQLNIESEDPQQQVKATAAAKKDQAAPKKVVIKKVYKVDEAADMKEGYEKVTDNKNKDRQGGRAARGTVEGRRGGRGRGEGGRGGRGRGGEGRGGQRRPRTAQVDENGNPTNVDRVEQGGNRQRYQGKAREEGHPQDRRQGHELRRGDRKGGHGRGNWGDKRKPEKEEAEGETPAAADNAEKKEDEKKEENAQAAEEEVKEPVKAEEEEEEETGITLDDFLANRKSAGIKAQAREAEKINQKNIQEKDDKKVHQTTINDNLTSKDTYATVSDANAHLFGFQGGDDEEFSAPRGNRGARGGARGGRGGRGGRQDRADNNRGGRRRGGNKLVVDDNAFPTL